VSVPLRPWVGLAPRSLSFDWDDPDTGERYEVEAQALYGDDEGGPAVAGVGPNVRIVHVRDFRGREVAGELFGTFASISIRDMAACLLEAHRL
jgi:hypothetical protein